MLKLKYIYKISSKHAFEKYILKGKEYIEQNNLINLARIEYSSAIKEKLEFDYKESKKSLLRKWTYKN